MSMRRATVERPREVKNYNIYCVNFHGTGLNNIKHEFKHRVHTGLRRHVFLLDLEDLQHDLDKQPRTSKQLKDYQDNPNNSLINEILQQIQNCRKDYDAISKQINDELKFDLYQYWLKDLEDKLVESLVDSVSIKAKTPSNFSASTKARKSRNSKISKGRRSSKKSMGITSETEEIVCMPLEKKEHNRVGQGEMVSKRKFIKDDPGGGKLYFILLGCMNEQFYLDLLSRDQPVQGIVNFIPTESNYDILLNNQQQRDFIRQTLESIKTLEYQLRQNATLKSVGMFTHALPVISNCLATKYHKEIYDQLTWSMYDIEMLQQQYNNYYLRPFQETDVALPPDVDLRQLYEMATTLSLRGHFGKRTLAGSTSDVSCMLAYLDSLLNTCAMPENILSDKEILLLSMKDSKMPKLNQTKNTLAESYKRAFANITKIRKFQRLFIEESNVMLVNMLQYASQDMFRNIYLACLDCHLWREYVTAVNLKDPLENDEDVKNFQFPAFLKLYSSEESCSQKLLELTSTYNDYQVSAIQRNCKLYTFRRIYNFLSEQEHVDVIPTRLCFRDFTLFRMEEFLRSLTTPLMTSNSNQEVTRKSSITKGTTARKSKSLDLEDNIFIRPNSLKAIKLSLEKDTEQSQTQRETEQRSSRKRSTQYERKSSARVSQEWVGLPPGHHLIKGYNLEDTLQEVKSKTSSYFFHHGSLQLYEEKWCFQETNKTLTFDINRSKIHLSQPRSKHSGILSNIRLETFNQVALRILYEPRECAKVVLNYPNGLSIYYRDMDCEQVWAAESSFGNETRRIATPYGAVVVFYQNDYMIQIMRYNGEIYKLYQYAPPEEEEEEDMLSEFSNNESMAAGDKKAEGDTERNQKQKGDYDKIQKLPQGQGDIKPRNIPNNPNASRYSEESISENPSVSPRSLKDRLKASLEFQLSFLNHITACYNLSYIHLKMTTSHGRRVQLTLDGEISESSACKLEEWHDYYANESYAQRSDGVKMIWSRDVLKCYHKDGTVFTTKTEEDYDLPEEDETRFLVSQSSSHLNIEDEDMVVTPIRLSTTTVNNFPSPVSKNYQHFLAAEEGEDHEDGRFICYTCSNWLIQHHHYAGVYFQWSSASCPTQCLVLMEILAIDEIMIYTSRVDFNPLYHTALERSSSTEKDVGSEKLAVHVWLGHQLHLTVTQESCEIFTVMERFQGEEDDAIASDSLTLKILFEDCLTDVFKYLIRQIATFQNYNGPITEKLYFVTLQGEDCQRRGFEFLPNLPESTQLRYCSGNCMIEAKPLQTMDELMTHAIEGFERDFKKFPRFCEQKPSDSETKFPMVLTTSIYCSVPSSLRDIAHICKYLETFENLTFKKMRRKFKQFLDCHLKPQLQMDLKILYSTKNWFKRQREHERRKFTETQRRGLYHAMLKHRKYPNYFKFSRDYRGNVDDIDFFEFMQTKCANQEVPRDEVYWKPHCAWNAKKSQLKSKTSNRCLYGTYDN